MFSKGLGKPLPFHKAKATESTCYGRFDCSYYKFFTSRSKIVGYKGQPNAISCSKHCADIIYYAIPIILYQPDPYNALDYMQAQGSCPSPFQYSIPVVHSIIPFH